MLTFAATAFFILASTQVWAQNMEDPEEAPGLPQSVAATPGNGQVTLTWEAPADDGGAPVLRYEYTYWISGGANPGFESAGSNLTTTVDGLDNGTEYALAVRAVNRAGTGGWAIVRTTPTTVPGVPQNFSTTPADGQVTLTWQAPASDGGSAVTGYEYRHAEGASVPTETAWQSAGTNLTATVSSLTNGTEYAFEVRAVNGAGESDPAAATATPSATVTKPAAPQYLAAAPGDGQVTLTWQAPANDGGSAITGYEYRYAEGATVPATTIWKFAGTDLTVTVSSLTNGTEYAFEVRAANRRGVGVAATAMATPAVQPSAPSAPQNLTATPGQGQITLAWEAPANDGGSAITGYEFRYAEGATVPLETVWRSAGTSRSFIVFNLTNGTEYAFEVRAVNGAGESEPAAATATPVQHPTITVRPELAAYRIAEGSSGAGVAIVAQTEVGGGRPNTAFRVSVVSNAVPGGAVSPTDYEALTVTVSFDPEDFTAVGPVFEARKTVVLTILDDSAAEADETFQVRLQMSPGLQSWVQIREADGTTVCGSDGCLVTVTIADNDSLPSAPQNLAATPGDGEVTLAWQAPADPGSSTVDRYEYRYAEGATVPDETAWQSAGTSLTATVGSLTEGTEYAFEVRAVSAAGEGAAAATTATPATVPGAPQNLQAKGTDKRVDLAWSSPSSNGGSDLVRYEVRYAEGASVPQDKEWFEANLYGTFFIASLENGTQYTFEVRAVNGRGAGPVARIQATPGIVPSAPQTLEATAGDEQVTLAWAAPSNDVDSAVTGYEYRHAAGASVPSATAWRSAGTSLTVTVGDLANGTEYAFEVRAVSAAGAGAPVAATATPTSVPGVPRNFSTTPADGQVTLTWQAPASDGGSAITGYEYRHAEGATVPTETTWQSAGTSLTATVGSLTNGTEYAFEVRAANGVGESDPAAATATPAIQPTVPSAPQNLTATPGDGQVTLAWQVSANDGGSAVTGYEYRHAEGASVPTETAWQSAGTNLTATVSSLTNGTEYAFEVRAANGAGESEAAAATATPAAPATAPGVPQNLTAVAGDGEVTLAWAAPASDGGSAVTGYEYRYAEGASVPAETGWTSVGAALTVTVQSLTNGTAYAFEIRAVSAAGEGKAAAKTATPAAPATVPAAPENLRATLGDRKVTLGWEPPASDGGTAVGRYEYRYINGGAVQTGAGDTRARQARARQAGTPQAGTPQWISVGMDRAVTVNSLENGARYAFDVRAVNDIGPGAAARVTVTPAAAPDAPRDLRAIPGDRKVTLNWRAPANDGGSPVRLYLYRHAEGDSVPAGTQWVTVQDTLTVTIENLTNGTQYAFEVLALSSAGTSVPARATATPLAPPTVAELQRHIAGFMLRRANALANNQPRLTRFLKAGGSGNSLAGRATELGGAVRGALRYRNVWLNAQAAWSAGAGSRSHYVFGTLGGHLRVNERLLAGVMLQFDMADETLPGREGGIDGTGWLIGPYFAAKLAGQPLFFEGRLLYGQTDNSLDHARGISGGFGTERWLAQVRMEGDVGLDAGLTLTPFMDLTWTADRQQGFRDSLGRQVGSQTVSLGQAKAGIDFRLPLRAERGTLALTGGLAGIFSSTEGGAAGAGFDGGRARVGLGLDYKMSDSFGVGLNGYYDGIGDQDYRGYGIGGELKLRF